ncbi:conserved hypothetical protein [Burkholderia pseudomallei 305]|nr:conserved hypothetical protein [Burkholderia pseudomallei 305]EEC34559.1 conserved hypothetical protein [Burkholderia pseudomallei 576]
MLFVFRRLFRRAHSGAQRLVGRVVYLAAQKARREAGSTAPCSRKTGGGAARAPAGVRAGVSGRRRESGLLAVQALSGSHSADRIHLNKFTRNYW